MNFRIALVVVAALTVGIHIEAQAPRPAIRAEFEVASVKRNSAGQPDSDISFSPSGRVAWTNITLRQLIDTAYPSESPQMFGGPGWIDTDRFDIVASGVDALRLDANGNPSRLFAMLRSLLEDRFRARIHMERRSVPAHALVGARADRTGPALAGTTVDCVKETEKVAAQGSAIAAAADAPAPCSIGRFPGAIVGQAIPLSRFAGALSPLVGRPVIDRTNLSGNFDIKRTWTDAGMDDPSLYAALQEQLGLTLDATRAEVEVTVIDHAELPTPD